MLNEWSDRSHRPRGPQWPIALVGIAGIALIVAGFLI